VAVSCVLVVVGSWLVVQFSTLIIACQRTELTRPSKHEGCCFFGVRRHCGSPFIWIRLFSLACRGSNAVWRICPSATSRFHAKASVVKVHLRREWRWAFLRIGLPLLATLVGGGLTAVSLTR